MRISVAPLLRLPIGDSARYELAEAPLDGHGEHAALAELGVSSFDAVVEATHTDPGVLLEGQASAVLGAECSRCLKPIDVRVVADFAEQYFATHDVASGAARADVPEDVATIDADFKIDLTRLLAEELSLATPMAPVCRPDCKGLCEECGEDLNVRPHAHEGAVDPRWSRLRSLELPREGSE